MILSMLPVFVLSLPEIDGFALVTTSLCKFEDGLSNGTRSMPTYEYFCTSCGFEFEEFQSIASEPISTCPNCQAHVQRKISGGSGLIFKGSGFYITDYKKSNDKSKESSVEKPTEKKSEDKSKSKAS